MLAVSALVVFAFVGKTQPDRQAQGGGRRGAGGQGNPPAAVLTTAAKLSDVPLFIDAVGTAKAQNTATVSPQVDGILTSVNFKEGQDVKKGDVLARIDPTTYQAALDQALAKKAQDAALLDNARRDLERYNRLAETNAGTRQQADTQRSTVAQLLAQTQSDQAQIDNARAILAYTTIVAPIDGRTGIRAIDEGNLVRAAGTSGIVTITQLQPISVFFNVPQQQLPRIVAGRAKEALRVDAVAGEDRAQIDRGVLVVIDNLVDQTTGTVRLKADFPNATYQLWPGAFVNVRLLVDTLKGVVTIPTSALQRGPKGPFVYLVNGDDTVGVRLVTVAQQDDRVVVIGQGVAAGDRIVTTGFSQLSDGARVAATDENAAAAPAAAGPARGTIPQGPGARQRGDGQGAGQGGGQGRRQGQGGQPGADAGQRQRRDGQGRNAPAVAPGPAPAPEPPSTNAPPATPQASNATQAPPLVGAAVPGAPQ